MKKEIVQKGDPVLGVIAPEVSVEEIRTPAFQEIIKNMHDTLADILDGVALAAPQIGVSKRLFVIANRAYHEDRKERHFVFINPKIIKRSKKKVEMSEGCLSVRWKYGETKRFKQATVEALDENGESFTMSGSGLIAQIFQHEIDHLDGILFDAHAENLRHMTAEEIKEYRESLEKEK